jgi:hypothetical protein
MKQKFLIILALLAVVLWVAPASAYTFNYTIDGLPVSATVTFTVDSVNDLIYVDIVNNQANPTSVIQCISGLSFTLSTGQSSGSLSSFSADARTIADGGSFTDATASTTHWQLQSGVTVLGGTGLKLTTLGDAQPKNTIIGPGPYAMANPSITGTSHEPVWFGDSDPNTTIGPVEFVLSVPGITAGTVVTNPQFFFGTEGVVPVPPSVLLLGSGLLGIGFLGWRRKKL